MENSLSILFYLRKNKGKNNGEAPIYMRITLNGARLDLSTHQFVLPENWDNNKTIVKGTKEEARIVNTKLGNMRTKVLKIFQQLETAGTPVTIGLMRDLLSGKARNRRLLVETFKDYNKSFASRVGHDIAQGTYKRHLVSCNKLEEFIKFHYHQTDFYLDELDYNFIFNFGNYLKTHDNNVQNTAAKHISLLKKIINHCLLQNWISKNPFLNYSCPYRNPDRAFLNGEELELLKTKQLPVNRLTVVRDMYIFSCYTGIPFSDMENLTPEDISFGIDGEKWIIFNRKKTGTRSPIPLLPEVLEIIERYKDYPLNNSKGKLLPMYSNQRMNGYLKEIATICGIEKVLTFHTARHTFATTVTLTNGVPVETVSKMLGHTSIKTTQIYSRVVDTKISNDMMELRRHLSNQQNQKKNSFLEAL